MDMTTGIPTVAIPGPSILPLRVREALARPMVNIYDGELLDVSDRVVQRLPSIARTTGRAFIVTANGHGAWQMAVSNTLLPGDKVLALESGRFAVIWGEYAEQAGATFEVLPGSWHDPVDPNRLEERLRADRTGEIKAIFVSHTDTASSVRNDIIELRAAIDAAGHDAMLMVDCIASLACDPYEMDEWGVDLTIGASQKGLMCPPGVSFVWAGDQALAAFDRVKAAGLPRVSYVDWERRLDPRGFYDTYAGTPPASHLLALDVALDMIDEEGGLDAVWRRHEVLGAMVRSAVDSWSTANGLHLNIESERHRSNAVTTIRTGAHDSEKIAAAVLRMSEVTLGIGMAYDPCGSFRIGHMGHVNASMVLGTLGSIEAALHALEVPVGGSGVGAGAVALAQLSVVGA